MPRVKLIYHGTDGRGRECWGFPVYPFGECPHPRGALRFDPRFGLPTSCYCRACGEAYLSPWLHLSDEEIAAARERAARIADGLMDK